MKLRALAISLVVVGHGLTSSCGRGGDATDGQTAAATETAAPVRDPSATGAHRAEELDEAARQLVAFLRGEAGFDRVRLADTVRLYVGREGGGTSAAHARAQLRDPSAWRVRGQGRATYAFAPPAGMTNLTTRVGRHFRCQEQALSSTFPDLAQSPHVGAKLEPADASSCIQTWNVTFVFDPSAKPPTLVAAVYDQFEW
jgi:hypothetical protein